jgi:acetyl-CoA synthetase
VLLRSGNTASAELAEAIRDSVRTRLARHECPRDVVFVESLPLTATGKIMRRELRRLPVT